MLKKRVWYDKIKDRFIKEGNQKLTIEVKNINKIELHQINYILPFLIKSPSYLCKEIWFNNLDGDKINILFPSMKEIFNMSSIEKIVCQHSINTIDTNRSNKNSKIVFEMIKIINNESEYTKLNIDQIVKTSDHLNICNETDNFKKDTTSRDNEENIIINVLRYELNNDNIIITCRLLEYNIPNVNIFSKILLKYEINLKIKKIMDEWKKITNEDNFPLNIYDWKKQCSVSYPDELCINNNTIFLKVIGLFSHEVQSLYEIVKNHKNIKFIKISNSSCDLKSLSVLFELLTPQRIIYLDITTSLTYRNSSIIYQRLKKYLVSEKKMDLLSYFIWNKSINNNCPYRDKIDYNIILIQHKKYYILDEYIGQLRYLHEITYDCEDLD